MLDKLLFFTIKNRKYLYANILNTIQPVEM